MNTIPEGDVWQYEPKWDGFRCLVFRDGEKVFLQSKSGQDLARYFPEVVQTILKLRPKKFVLDTELVIPKKGNLSFDDLLLRIHPAASRIQKLAAESPALLIVFDLLVSEQGKSLLKSNLEQRRKTLELFAGNYFPSGGGLRLSPATRDPKVAREWFKTAGKALDGIIAKRVDIPYRSGDRTGMEKVKPHWSVDCVVGGFRYATKRKVVGSLLLGLYDNQGLLHHVGFCSSLKVSERKELTGKLEALVAKPGFTGKAPGGPSRWSGNRSADWQPLKPSLVVEVRYDHFTGGRFRHGTKFVRWRPDKAPEQCLMDQVAGEGHPPVALLDLPVKAASMPASSLRQVKKSIRAASSGKRKKSRTLSSILD